MHTIALSCSQFKMMVRPVKIVIKFYTQTKEPCSYMTHGEEEAQTKEDKKKRAVSPSTTHNRLYIFLFIYFRGGRRNRRKQHEEDMKLCPNTTHGEEEGDCCVQFKF